MKRKTWKPYGFWLLFTEAAGGTVRVADPRRYKILQRVCGKAAALLQLPYLLWVTFAVYLNLGVLVLNP